MRYTTTDLLTKEAGEFRSTIQREVCKQRVRQGGLTDRSNVSCSFFQVSHGKQQSVGALEHRGVIVKGACRKPKMLSSTHIT